MYGVFRKRHRPRPEICSSTQKALVLAHEIVGCEIYYLIYFLIFIAKTDAQLAGGMYGIAIDMYQFHTAVYICQRNA